MHLTSTEVTLAIPLGVILGAAVSVVGQVVTLRGQRQLAEDARIFEKRASIYVTLIKELHNFIIVEPYYLEIPSYETLQRYEEFYSSFFDLRPPMVAFSSPQVRVAFTSWFDQLAATLEFLRMLSPEDKRAILQVRSLMQDHSNDAKRLIRDVTADLGISIPKVRKRLSLKPRATSLSTLEGPPPE